MITAIVFYALGLIIVIGALTVVLARHLVSSFLALVVTMFSVGGLYILLQAPFLAAVQLIVYAGAVMVMFLFIIMLLDLRESRAKLLPVSPLRIISAVLAGLLSFLLAFVARDLSGVEPVAAGEGFLGSVTHFGALLFNQYYYLFELAGILLTAALVGAVILSGRAAKEEA